MGGNLNLAGGTFNPVITGNTHSTIQVIGNASLGGTLRPEFSGYNPVLGDSWTLMTADTVSGTFADVDTSAAGELQRGVTFAVSVQPSNSVDVVLSFANRLILNVDRGSGAMSFENAVDNPIEIDSYSIGSPSGSLDVGAWQSLQDAGGVLENVHAGVFTPGAIPLHKRGYRCKTVPEEYAR